MIPPTKFCDDVLHDYVVQYHVVVFNSKGLHNQIFAFFGSYNRDCMLKCSFIGHVCSCWWNENKQILSKSGLKYLKNTELSV